MEFLRSYFHTPTRKEMDSSVYITWAGHRICTPQHVVGPRILDNYKIILVTKGRGIFRQFDKEYDIEPGDIFILFPGVKHFYCADPNDPWEIMWVLFNGKLCEDIFSSINLTPGSSVIKGAVSHTIVKTMENIVNEMEKVSKEVGNDVERFTLKATGYLYMLFSELIRLTRTANEKTAEYVKQDSIKKALKFIELNYYHDIDVDMLCKYVNFSRSHFSRSFKSKVGVTIPEYINQIRIRHAKLLLKNSDLNVNEIAKSVGFDDQFYFSRIFSKIEGVPPAQYRKAIQE